MNQTPALKKQKAVLPLSMQFQLSVFHRDSYFSYQITTEDHRTFHFHLHSAPPDKTAPKEFLGIRTAKDQWQFEPEVDEEFQDDVLAVLKRAKLA